MYVSIYKNKELENEVSSDMSYFWYSDDVDTLLEQTTWSCNCMETKSNVDSHNMVIRTRLLKIN